MLGPLRREKEGTPMNASITRSSKLEFETGTVVTMLTLAPIGHVACVDGRAVDDMNNRLVEQLSSKAVPLINGFAAKLDLETGVATTRVADIVGLDLLGYNLTVDLQLELKVAIEHDFIRSLILHAVIPDVLKSAADIIAEQAMLHADEQAGYQRRIREKMLQELGPFGSLGSLFGGMPNHSNGREPELAGGLYM